MSTRLQLQTNSQRASNRGASDGRPAARRAVTPGRRARSTRNSCRPSPRVWRSSRSFGEQRPSMTLSEAAAAPGCRARRRGASCARSPRSAMSCRPGGSSPSPRAFWSSASAISPRNPGSIAPNR